MSKPRKERIEFLLTPAEKELITYASSVAGKIMGNKSLGQFVRENELALAKTVIQSQLTLGEDVPEFSTEAQDLFSPHMAEGYAKPVEQRQQEHAAWLEKVSKRADREQ